MNWKSMVVACFAATLCLLSTLTYAQDDDSSRVTGGWNYGVTLGVAEWPDLSDVYSAAGGNFDLRGFALELSAHKPMWRWGSADVLLGVDLGIITTDGNIPGVFEELTQRSAYLTPSIKIRFGEYGRRYINLESGIGYYQTDFAELLCDDSAPSCIELADPFNADAPGGYIGVTLGLGAWFTSGLKVHYADFGAVQNISGVTGDLGGPIYVLSVGAMFGGKGS